jgi:quercetin dioxygenase-like cupin family protein
MTTTFIKKRAQMHRAPLDKCHDGVGALDWTDVLGGKELKERKLNFFHDNILAPGVSIGVHPHKDDEEYYFIISGKGTMTLDDKTFEVGPGDITAVFPGGKHGLANTGNEAMHMVVVSTKA